MSNKSNSEFFANLLKLIKNEEVITQFGALKTPTNTILILSNNHDLYN